MHISAKGVAFLRAQEGFVSHWYADAGGVGTIGIGFTWASRAFREWWKLQKPGIAFAPGATMTRAEAEAALVYLCDREYGRYVDEALAALKPAQHIFDAAVSVVYNLGPSALGWDWATRLKEGRIVAAARLLRSTGTTAKGKRLVGLVARRREEAELLENGDYTIGRAAEAAPGDAVLTRGERGPAVAELQTMLARRHFYDGVIDGRFGRGTEAALIEFQRVEGLVADGDAGPKTLAALAALTSITPTLPLSPETVVRETPDVVPVLPRVEPPPPKPSGARTGGIVAVLTAIGIGVVAGWRHVADWIGGLFQ